jgi:hypothetical protein
MFSDNTDLRIADRSASAFTNNEDVPSARWILALLWPPRFWRPSSRQLPEPFLAGYVGHQISAASSFGVCAFIAALLRRLGSPAVFRAKVNSL